MNIVTYVLDRKIEASNAGTDCIIEVIGVPTGHN